MGYLPRTDCVRRIRRELIRGSIVYMLLWIGLSVFVFPLIPLGASSVWLLPVMVLTVAANFGYMAYVLRRNLVRLEGCNWRRCCWCEYDTTPIGESGMCPECGREFSSALLKADFQDLMDQLGWWLPKRWRTIPGSSSGGPASDVTSHEPLRGPKKGAKDYIDRTKRASAPIGILGMIAGFAGAGMLARLFHVKPASFFLGFVFAMGFALLTSVLSQMPYLLYRRRRLARRNWTICPWCERDTRDIGTEGTCPECGGEFSAPDLKADFDATCRHMAWMFWLRPDDGSRPRRSEGSRQ